MRIRQANKILSMVRVVDNRSWTIHRKASVAKALKTRYARRWRLNKKLIHGAWLRQMKRFAEKAANQPWKIDIQVDMGTLPVMEPPMNRTCLTGFNFEPQVIESAGQFSGHRTRWILLPITTTAESD